MQVHIYGVVISEIQLLGAEPINYKGLPWNANAILFSGSATCIIHDTTIA